MDLFLINGQDGISLPEMIDWDIKLCDSEISEEVGVNNILGLGYDLPSLDIEDEPNPLWAHSYSGNSNSSFELDFLSEGASSLMVNPSSVMPFVSSHRRILHEEPVHIQEEDEDDEEEEEEEESSDEKSFDPDESTSSSSKVVNISSDIKVEVIDDDIQDKPEIKVVEEVSDQNMALSASVSTQEMVTLPLEFISVSMDGHFKEVTPSKKNSFYKRQVMPLGEDSSLRAYPKPAYSYSCLIAMALKNSPSGSLPVSEIYSFMCHHFPYFKTAPNGWKNSVRHNLSLNKCFEKIEKPPGSGSSGSQRKGCLWAMNPIKITKMDEEVAKWSRKDPSAIKKAMVCPDNLELLERGEMKDFTAFSAVEAEEDAEEVKEEGEIEDFAADVEDDRILPIDDESEDEISQVPPSLQPFEPKFANLSRKNISKTSYLCDKPMDINSMELEIEEGIYDELETRTLLSVDESTPIYAVDPVDENVLIELPVVKRPRVQGNYIYQPVLNMKRHNITGFRSIKIQSP